MATSEEDSPSAQSRPVSKGVHYVAKCVLKGTAVLQAVRGHLRSSSSFDVVFGKETSIELVVIGEDGVVQSICEQAVFGTIKDLAIVRWNEKFHAPIPQTQGRDLLVVLSESGKLSFLAFCNEMHRFFPVAHVQLSNPGNQRHQLGRKLAVDSNGCFVAVSAYEDRLALFSVSISARNNIIDKKIFYPPEIDGDTSSAMDIQRTNICGVIWSMCFISKDCSQLNRDGYNPIVAVVLNRSGGILNELLLLEWNMREDALYVISQYTEAGPLSLDIVEVPHVFGFAFLFRDGDALLMDLRDPHNPSCVYKTTLSLLSTPVEEQTSVQEPCKGLDVDDEGIFNVAARALLELRDSKMEIIKCDDPMSIDSESSKVNSTSKCVNAWSWEPGNSTHSRLMFCLNTGELFMIEVSSDPEGIRVNLSDCLYRGPTCKALLWVEGELVAALVEMGDGMVLKLENGKLVYSSPIQNIAPILDMTVVDYHDENQDQIFACCGKAPEGSLRVIRSGISVEKLLRTAPIYQGITGTWTMRMKVTDRYHSFLVLSFVEETRVLSVGVSFTDVTEAVGFQPDVCTLACGLVGDGLLVQIHGNAVRLCLPTVAAHPEGIFLSAAICTSWSPDKASISSGAVGHSLIIVATSNPCFLYILGVRSLSAYRYEIYEMQHVKLQNELSCIAIPQKRFECKPPTLNMGDNSREVATPAGVEIGNSFVIGTHKPSVEILSFVPKEGIRVLARGVVSLTNTLGTAISGCVPQDVRLVLVDRLYILAGLRNGMLLRMEWPATSMAFPSELPNQSPFIPSCFGNVDAVPSSMATPALVGQQYCASNEGQRAGDNVPVDLQLIAIRRIGITPVFLVPLSDSLDADIIALSDRPWLLQTARRSLSYTSISFQPATHVTPVCSMECPKGILFVAENSLHLVEMVHCKRLNVQKFYLGGTPRKVLYHSESRLLLVMRTDLNTESSSSDICCVDPLSGSVLSTYKLEPGETGKSMQLVKVANEQVLVVGTSLSTGRAIMPSGEAESTKGRLLVLCLEHTQNSASSSWIFCSKTSSSTQLTSPFREIVGYATEQLSSSSLCSSPDDNSCEGVKLEESEAWQWRVAYQTNMPGMVLSVCPYLDRYFLVSAGNIRVRKFALGRTRFAITCLTTQFTRIAVGDCRDGILFYSYQEDLRKLEQLYCDPMQRLVADCTLMDMDTAFVSDRKGSIAVLSCTNHLEDNASPECNLTLSCSYYIGEIAMSITKGSFSYKLPADDVLKGYDSTNTIMDLAHNTIVASTLLGSVMIFIPITREEHELLEAVQARLVVHPLTSPILGNDHSEFRGRESLANVPKMLDGDMLAQFLELTSMQQEAVLVSSFGLMDVGSSSSKPPSRSPIPVNKVVQLLERLHYALN
ncbi:splicing factor 3B subunit 3 isoform X2 [Macadamia integrifolia]|uniref:splicing factor 3B subunit 3 isoform X2 n=1 Tax=Macadamia integrifolia TaxID=60698 RepID=UPI001C4E8B79|nr:splicing factor 3B subunit 3 isoform X2 [Macadamia integrifolia]